MTTQIKTGRIGRKKFNKTLFVFACLGALFLAVFAYAPMFGLLLACMLALSGFGAQVYRALTAAQARNNASRAALSYVSARLRAADTAGAVALGAGPEGPALLLREEGYETRIYLYEGCLVEEYAAAGSALAPQNAQIIARTGSFSAAAAGGLYTVTTDAGVVQVCLHSGEGSA